MQYCSVVVWTPPTQLNGVITGYTLQFNTGTQVSLGPTENFYEVSDQEKKTEDIAVQVHNHAVLLYNVYYNNYIGPAH